MVTPVPRNVWLRERLREQLRCLELLRGFARLQGEKPVLKRMKRRIAAAKRSLKAINK